MIVNGIDIRIYFLLFIIYGVIGWCMEVICKLIQYKKFTNRGFLIGPCCQIYGYGALLITFLLKKYIEDPWVLFIMAILICGTLEYLTSLFMEKIFNARWWDYSQRKFNINGRVCLNTIIPFGLLGLLITYVTNPIFISLIDKLPEMWLNIVSGVIAIIFVADNIISAVVISFVKKTEKGLGKDLDNTDEITKKVKEILVKKSALHRRIINAYPTFEAVKIKLKAKKEEIKKVTEKTKEKIIKKIENKDK